MNTEGLIVRLRATCPAFDNRVFGIGQAAGFEQLDEIVQVPAAFVAPLGERADDSDTAGAVVQPVRQSFAVVVVVANTDERGQDASEQVDAVRAELFVALIGWVPAEEHAPLQFEGGAFVDLTRARMAYQFDFSTDYVVMG